MTYRLRLLADANQTLTNSTRLILHRIEKVCLVKDGYKFFHRRKRTLEGT